MQYCVPQVQALQQKAKEENCEVVVVSAQVLFSPPQNFVCLAGPIQVIV